MEPSYCSSAVQPAVVVLRGDCLLLCARSDDAGFAFVFEAVTLALDLDDLAVMQQAVEHGGG